MKRNGFALVFSIAILWVLPGMVSAQVLKSAEVRFETNLVVDVRPLDAQVFVDGRPLGTARELVAQSISVPPGPHILQIAAAGFHPFVGGFTADPRGSVNQFVVTLVPE